MALATMQQGTRPGEFIVTEVGKISRDNITLLLGNNLVAGSVLGRIEIGSVTTAAGGSNTGNGTLGTVTTSAGAQAGAYTLKITEAATNAGNFEVIDPQGDVIGIGTVGVAFSGGGLAFTLADGSTDFAVGDKFTITVAAGSGKYTAHDPAATDGSQIAAGILFAATDATDGDMRAVAVVRLAEVNSSRLTWKTNISTGDKAAGIAALAAQHIILRD